MICERRLANVLQNNILSNVCQPLCEGDCGNQVVCEDCVSKCDGYVGVMCVNCAGGGNYVECGLCEKSYCECCDRWQRECGLCEKSLCEFCAEGDGGMFTYGLVQCGTCCIEVCDECREWSEEVRCEGCGSEMCSHDGIPPCSEVQGCGAYGCEGASVTEIPFAAMVLTCMLPDAYTLRLYRTYARFVCLSEIIQDCKILLQEPIQYAIAGTRSMCEDCCKAFPHEAKGTWAGCGHVKCGDFTRNDFYDPSGGMGQNEHCTRCNEERGSRGS